jgi:hypothetical protein
LSIFAARPSPLSGEYTRVGIGIGIGIPKGWHYGRDDWHCMAQMAKQTNNFRQFRHLLRGKSTKATKAK